MKYIAVEPRFYSVRKATSRRKTTRGYKRVSALSKQMGSAMQVNFVKGIKTFKKKVSDKELFDAWRTGRYQSIMSVIPWDDLEKDLEPSLSHIGDSVGGSSKLTIASLPAPVRNGLRFDTENPNIQSYIANRSSELVTNIQEDTKNIINQSITRSFDKALTPRDVANQIKGSIGLTDKYEQAVYNYKDALMKKGTNPAQAEALAGRYTERLLDARAMTIARTETRRAANYGQLSVWKEAVEQELIDGDGAQKVWIVDGDPCPICEPMDGEAVGLYDSWTITFSDGSQDQVDIPNEAHPNCYCGMELEFAQQQEEETEVETIEDQPDEEDSEDSDES